MQNLNDKKPFLILKNISFSVKEKEILKNINIQIDESQFISIIGPSGSGKTTLLNIISTIIKPSTGEIISKEDIDNIGYVFQDFNLYDDISAYKNIYLSIKNSTKWLCRNKYLFIKSFLSNNLNIINNSKMEQFNNLEHDIFNNNDSLFLKKTLKFIKKIEFEISKYFLKNFHLKKLFYFLKKKSVKKLAKNDILHISKNLEIESILQQKASTLSGGQKQRVSIAKAIAKLSSVILLDEPFAAFDAKLKEKAREWLKNIQKQYKITMIFVTHDQNDAMLISDKIIFIDQKTVMQFDCPSVLFNDPKNLKIAKFIGFPEIIFLYEEKNKFYYIRSNKLLITKKSSNKNKIIDIKTNGNFDILTVYSNKYEKKIEIISEFDKYKIGELVDITFDKKDLLIFDKKGERIYV